MNLVNAAERVVVATAYATAWVGIVVVLTYAWHHAVAWPLTAAMMVVGFCAIFAMVCIAAQVLSFVRTGQWGDTPPHTDDSGMMEQAV